MNLKNNEPEALLILGVLFLYIIGGIWPFKALPWFAYLIVVLPIISWTYLGDDKETRQTLIEVERQKTHLLAAKTSLIPVVWEGVRPGSSWSRREVDE